MKDLETQALINRSKKAYIWGLEAETGVPAQCRMSTVVNFIGGITYPKKRSQKMQENTLGKGRKSLVITDLL